MSTDSVEQLLPNLSTLSLSDSTFFNKFVLNNGFVHNATASSTAEFDRLKDFMHWDPGSQSFRRNLTRFRSLHDEVPSPSSTPGQPAVPTYFDTFRSTGFIPDPTASVLTEFKRLAKLRGWKEGSKQYRRHKSQCFAGEFETHYGNKTERLEGWQNLCYEVGIDPAPPSVTQCKKASILCAIR